MGSGDNDQWRVVTSQLVPSFSRSILFWKASPENCTLKHWFLLMNHVCTVYSLYSNCLWRLTCIYSKTFIIWLHLCETSALLCRLFSYSLDDSYSFCDMFLNRLHQYFLCNCPFGQSIFQVGNDYRSRNKNLFFIAWLASAPKVCTDEQKRCRTQTKFLSLRNVNKMPFSCQVIHPGESKHRFNWKSTIELQHTRYRCQPCHQPPFCSNYLAPVVIGKHRPNNDLVV